MIGGAEATTVGVEGSWGFVCGGGGLNVLGLFREKKHELDKDDKTSRIPSIAGLKD